MTIHSKTDIEQATKFSIFVSVYLFKTEKIKARAQLSEKN